MKFFKLQLKKDDWLEIEKEDRRLMATSCVIANDLNVLLRVIITSGNLPPDCSEIQRSCSAYQQMCLIRILCGKIWESIKWFEKSKLQYSANTSIAKKIENLLKEAKHEAQVGHLKHIRDKFAFHFDSKSLMKGEAFIDSEDDMSLLISKNNGSCIFTAGEVILLRGIYGQICKEDQENASYLLLESVTSCVHHINEINSIVMTYILDRNGKNNLVEVDYEGINLDLEKFWMPALFAEPRTYPQDSSV